ncbi:MAG: hypothetical protein K8R59_08715 [Thermoanaerobaculales bacterium]|nr:hypothetical protein [Thermoanaerobaculales bacterium]
MNPRQLFTEEDLENIRKATGRAENRTSGEIVPVIVGVCGDYEGAVWKVSTMGALLAALIAGVVHGLGGFWSGFAALWVTLPTVTGAAIGYLLVQLWPGLRRAMISADSLEDNVRDRARQAFLEEEVFATRERTGILIFLALFEKRVVVLGDEGINRAVTQEAWDEVVAHLVDGIREGRPGPALVEAIGECGRLLENHGVEIRPDDTDELADGLRMEER